MIDIHCHILPGVDDGPDSLGSAVKMAQSAVKEGVQTIIATPHCGNGMYNSSPELIESRCCLLNQELEKQKIPLTVRPGAENYLTTEVATLWEMNRVMGLNAKRHILLLELPGLFIFDGILKVLKNLIAQGVTAIIAHPERNPTLLKQPQALNSLIWHGAKIQVTAGSFCGDYGKYIKAFAEQLCVSGAIDYIASDMHPGRQFRMGAAFKRVKKLTDEGNALRMMKDAPGALLSIATDDSKQRE